MKEGAKEIGYENIMEELKNYIKPFLRNAIESVYELDVKPVSYIFPYEKIEKGSRVVLYGAGKVGKSYANCLIQGEYAVLTGWIDNAAPAEFKHIEIKRPEAIVDLIYDYIVIAIADVDLVRDIRNYLLESYGVDEEKIIWKKCVELF